jgi:hypothetical protein
VGELEARFRAPVPLGSSLSLGADPDAGSFTVAREGRIAVGGRFAFDPAGSN